MKQARRKARQQMLRFLLLTAVAFLMIYPLLWLAGSTLRDNPELFASAGSCRCTRRSTAGAGHLTHTAGRSVCFAPCAIPI